MSIILANIENEKKIVLVQIILFSIMFGRALSWGRDNSTLASEVFHFIFPKAGSVYKEWTWGVRSPIGSSRLCIPKS